MSSLLHAMRAFEGRSCSGRDTASTLELTLLHKDKALPDLSKSLNGNLDQIHGWWYVVLTSFDLGAFFLIGYLLLFHCCKPVNGIPLLSFLPIVKSFTRCNFTAQEDEMYNLYTSALSSEKKINTGLIFVKKEIPTKSNFIHIWSI